MNAMMVVAAVSLMTAMACLDGPRIAALRGAGPPSAAEVDPPITAGQAQGLRGWWAAHITAGRLRVGLLAAAVVWLLLGQRVTGLVAGAAAMPASMVLLGWAEADGAALRLTEAGTVVFEKAARLQTELQRERMRGITEDEYVTAITVLQRTIENVGGRAWHW